MTGQEIINPGEEKQGVCRQGAEARSWENLPVGQITQIAQRVARTEYDESSMGPGT